MAALGPVTTAGLQPLLAGLLYVVFHLPRLGPPSFAAIQGHRRALISLILLRGVIGSLLICYALLLTPSIKVMFFTKLEPYLILFWLWLLQGSVIARGQGVLLTLHVLAAIILSTDGILSVDQSSWGDLLILAAVALFAYTYLGAAKLSQALGPTHLNGLVNLSSGILLLPFTLLAFGALGHFGTFSGWGNLVLTVLLFNVGAMELQFRSLHFIPSWLSSALRAVGPVLAAPVAYLLYGQTLSPLQIGAAVVVVGTSALLSIERRSDRS